MELTRGKHKASKFDTKELINIMPDILVTNILDRLPLQDVVRTSVLSRNWRFKWTLLSKLVFDVDFFKHLLETKGENNHGRIISRLLLHLKGTITTFVLYMEEMSKLEDEDINHWIMFLSGKGIKDLTLCKNYGSLLKLPTHLFSFLELKHLKLRDCCFDPPASFHGFPNLLSLELTTVQFESSKFEEIIASCPLLEILNLGPLLQPPNTNGLYYGKVKLVEIAKLAKLANLKILSFLLRNLHNEMFTSSSSIFMLVGFLPKLQELHLDFRSFKFPQGAAKGRSPTSFPSLKTLTLAVIDLGNGIMLSCVVEFIRCSTNLQTLAITTSGYDAARPPAIPITIVSLQLQTVVFRDLKGLESEVCLIKYILECSPFLKKIVIHPHSSLASGEKLFTRKLLKLHRASPIAEIDLY